MVQSRSKPIRCYYNRYDHASDDRRQAGCRSPEIRPHIPVIICTGYSERMSAEKAEALGVRKYIEKPIDLLESGFIASRGFG
jgi:CheY-like chemotaxis protein